ncbi:hypothetical protein UO65_5114 [Actinokineospora spheciospongiae]|uniref:AAA+ ATPase domain-containing protein n=1 Tax=Actinokineospora spheciospongiae TaxID=909613 RepID=W7IH20_9PSEU|nr:ATP-binding protein [Actinokineospora spheciospongiae]EWC59573.1 hypothetical protein UO65_5114 [Actinokineospora spheciospongiae]
MSTGGAGGKPVNPFVVPHFDRGPLRPLRPFEHPEHEGFYVDVCGFAAALDWAESAFDDFTELARGGYVLVAGESGCGKSAMVNRLADRVRAGLVGIGLRAHVIDLTAAVEEQERSVDQRVNLVCKRLLPALQRNAGLLRPGAAALWQHNDDPRLIFPELETALEPAAAAVVLLPTPGDLVLEVVRYAKMFSSPRVVFLAESSLLGDSLMEIEEELEDFRPPVVVQMQTLSARDVDRFVDDRLSRHAGSGVYPRVSPEGLRTLAMISPSVKTLQRAAHGTFKMLRDQGADYSPAYAVTAEDFRRWLAGQLGPRGPRGGSR